MGETLDRLDWHRFRMEGIGGSDAPVIHGMSKYRKWHELLQEKANQIIKDEPSNFIQQLGHEIEPKLRATFSLDYFNNTGVSDPFEPQLVVHPKKSYLRASLDGLSVDKKTFIECKLVGDKVLMGGVVPIAYFIQMQHQYLCAGCEIGYMVMCNMKGQGTRIIPVPKDDSFIEIHKRRCKEFWDEVKKLREELTHKAACNEIVSGLE